MSKTDKKFSDGFIADLYDLLQMCGDNMTSECTIMIPDPECGVTLTAEIKFFVEKAEMENEE